jgi:hypothetical protein
VCFAFLPVPATVPSDAAHTEIGRLGVSVADRPPPRPTDDARTR